MNCDLQQSICKWTRRPKLETGIAFSDWNATVKTSMKNGVPIIRDRIDGVAIYWTHQQYCQDTVERSIKRYLAIWGITECPSKEVISLMTKNLCQCLGVPFNSNEIEWEEPNQDAIDG